MKDDWPTAKLFATDRALRRAQSLLAYFAKKQLTGAEKNAIEGALTEIHEALNFAPPRRHPCENPE